MSLEILAATFHGCSFEALNEPQRLEDLLRQAVERSGLTLLHLHTHAFEPQGVTAVALLAESHINLHTWPEHGLLFLDAATCTDRGATHAVLDVFSQALQPREIRRHADRKVALEVSLSTIEAA